MRNILLFSTQTRARERIFSLKDYLERYSSESPDDDLVCSISDGKNGMGYYPVFKKVKAGHAATTTFWEPHFIFGKKTTVVCDSLLFFYEHQRGRMLRYVDTNIERVNRSVAREKLDLHHSEHHTENLLAGHFYIDVGAVLGAERVREHFWDVWERRIPLIVEKEETNQAWKSGSPVLISTARTNTFMERIYASDEASKLNFRLHSDRFAWVTVKAPTKDDLTRLKRLKKDIQWEGGESFTTAKPELTLGIVSRMPNPKGDGGVITFISSDATRNATQMAVALTEERVLRQIFDAMKWPYTRPLPAFFEMLFLVRLWPGNLDDDAKSAELLSWRLVGEAPVPQEEI